MVLNFKRYAFDTILVVIICSGNCTCQLRNFESILAISSCGCQDLGRSCVGCKEHISTRDIHFKNIWKRHLLQITKRKCNIKCSLKWHYFKYNAVVSIEWKQLNNPTFEPLNYISLLWIDTNEWIYVVICSYYVI